MKKLCIVLCLILTLCLTLALASCDDGSADQGTDAGGSTPTEDKVIEGVTLTNTTYTYDGAPKSTAVTGTLPAGVSVAYQNETATDAGVYTVTATLSGEGYTTLTLTATMTINKADITGVTATAEQSVQADGQYHNPVFSGTLPAGVTVKLMVDGTEAPNGLRAVGNHNVKLVFSGKNHNTLEIPITYKIKLDAVQLAKDVIDAFGATPDPWDLLPESFAPSYHTVTATPTFTNFTNISAIPANGIGKQMHMAYNLLNKTSKALSYVNTVMGAMNIVKELYTGYLDTNPTDYQTYTGSAAGFTFTISLGETAYTMSATVSSVRVVIFADTEAETYGAFVQLTNTTALRYTVAQNKLTVAMNVLNSGSVLLEFVRDEDENVTGMLYEYASAGSVEIIANSAMIHVGEDYTTVIGTKGDFLLGSEGRNCEIYDNDTGRLVGAEVQEVSLGVEFNTYWFHMGNINGLTSVKHVDGDIFINGHSSKLENKKMGASFGAKLASRRYDVEMKTMYFYTYNTSTEEYETVSCEIPMLFVQEEVYSTFGDDFEEKNGDALGSANVSLSVTNGDLSAIDYGYAVLLPAYSELKDAVTQQDIIDYCSR